MHEQNIIKHFFEVIVIRNIKYEILLYLKR